MSTQDAFSPIVETPRGAGWRPWLLLLGVYALVTLLRAGAPSDLAEGDQPKQADYVLDIALNGNWILQHHADGSVQTKPPLYNWLAAPLVIRFGTHEWCLRAPSVAAGLLALLLLYDLFRRLTGPGAALHGTLAALLTSMYAKQLYYARTDMWLAATVVLQLWAATRWEEAGRRHGPRGSGGSSLASGWLWLLWGGAAVGGLAKGPLSPALAHLALLAWWGWEGKLLERYRRIGLWWGAPLALLPVGAWFGLALRTGGEAVTDALVRAEMLDRFSDAGSTADENRGLLYYVPLLLARSLPWSLFALAGLALRPWRRAEGGEPAHRAHRAWVLLASWFLTSFLLFSVVPSKRGDRIFPALIAFALFGGWTLHAALRRRADLAGGHPGERPVRLAVRVAGALFAAAGALALAGSTGALGPFLERADGADLARAFRLHAPAAALFGAGLLAAGAGALAAPLARRRLVALALFGGAFAFLGLYQHVVGRWARTPLPAEARRAAAVAREAEADGLGGTLLLTLPHWPIHYPLGVAGSGTPPGEARQILRTSPAPRVVVGTVLAEEDAGAAATGTAEAGPGTLAGGSLGRARAAGFRAFRRGELLYLGRPFPPVKSPRGTDLRLAVVRVPGATAERTDAGDAPAAPDTARPDETASEPELNAD